jgi:NADH-quinone oxidoreductase subunit L
VIQGIEAGEHASGHAKSKNPMPGVESAAAPAHFDAQDMRNMGGLRHRMKLTYWVYLAGALALSGVFPLSGFFSKDEILAEASRRSPGVLVLLLVAAFLTAFYMGRQVVMVFFGKPRSDPASRARENPAVMTLPLVVLALLAVIGGVVNLPGVHTLEDWLAHTITNLTPGEFLLPLALLALVLALLGLYLGWVIYRRYQSREQADPLSGMIDGLFTALNHKWWVDELYNRIVINPYKKFSELLAQPFDLGFIDAIGNGLGEATQGLSGSLRRLQSGFVRSYALVMLVGVVAALGFLIFNLR